MTLMVAVAVALITGALSGEPQVVVGSGVSPDQASGLKRSFDSDRDAQNQALASNDAVPAQGKVTGNALRDLEQQIQTNRAQGQRLRRQVRPLSTEVARNADPNDPEVVLEVHQTGSIHQDLLGQTGDTVLSSSDLTYDGRYWMRAAGSAYAITDAQVNEQPLVPAPFPWWAAGAGLLVVVAVMAMLVPRVRRARQTAGAPMRASSSAMPPVPASLQDSRPESQAYAPPKLVIRTFGGLQLMWKDEDLTPVVLGRPVLGFLWLWLLVAAIANPASQLLRDDICEQAFPGIDRKSQQGRLRGHLHELKGFPVLWERLVVQRKVLSFDLRDCEVDAVEVLNLSRGLRAAGSIDPARMAHGSSLLASTEGEFLPAWGGIVAGATNIEGTAVETVEELRQVLEIARADILSVLADGYLARYEPGPAIAALEQALGLRPERQDIAEKLVPALRAAGRDEEAGRLRDRYGLRR